MAVLAPTVVLNTGVVIPAGTACAAGGDLIPNDGKVWFEITNGDATPTNVTIDSVAPCNQGSDHDIVKAVANGTSQIFGPYDPLRFNNSSQQLSLSYSKVTSLTILVFRMSL